MRKKILLFIFSLILSFVFLDNLYAREIKICTYVSKSGKDTLEVKYINGEVQEGDARFYSEKEMDNVLAVKNGEDSLSGVNFTGNEYYEKTKLCPERALLTSAPQGRFVYLSDKLNLDASIKAIEKKYPLLYEDYPKILFLKGTADQKKEEEEWQNSLSASCMAFTSEQECRNGYKKGQEDAELKFSCIWVKNEFDSDGYCNSNDLVYVECGSSYDIPYEAPKIISFVVYLLKIGTPIILIFFSIIPLVKALASSNEDELKKAQKSLIKKLIAAALVFFVVSIVQFVIMKVADISETNNISDCFDCFLNNNCESTAYYKTNVGGTYLCDKFSNDADSWKCPQYDDNN